jgi:hypothetical protein
MKLIVAMVLLNISSFGVKKQITRLLDSPITKQKFKKYHENEQSHLINSPNK